MTTELLVLAAPVFTVDGELVRDLARDVVNLEVSEDLGGLRSFSGRFQAIDPFGDGTDGILLHLDGESLDFGSDLELALGPDDNQHTVFIGAVSALEATFVEGAMPTVTVLAEDPFHQLRTTRRSHSYEEMSDGDIARAIADEHGIDAQIDADGPTYDVVQQLNQTDLAFLRERARRIRAEIWVDADGLHFVTRDRRSGPELTLVQGNHLVAVRLRADLAHQRTAVKVSGYDAAQREVIEYEADSATIDGEVSGGRTGPAVLDQAIGARPTHRVRDIPVTGDDAEAWARAEMLARSRRFVTVEAETRGTPELTVGSIVRLERVGQPFEGGGYYVTGLSHTYDLDHGHRTRFSAERPTVNEGG